eukprot:COSAG04_NODE_2078_length_4851_cov_2.384891_4_plen_222_part_00
MSDTQRFLMDMNGAPHPTLNLLGGGAHGWRVRADRRALPCAGWLHVPAALSADELRVAKDASTELFSMGPGDPRLPAGFAGRSETQGRIGNAIAFDRSLESLAFHPAIWPIVMELTMLMLPPPLLLLLLLLPPPPLLLLLLLLPPLLLLLLLEILWLARALHRWHGCRLSPWSCWSPGISPRRRQTLSESVWRRRPRRSRRSRGLRSRRRTARRPSCDGIV